MLEKADGAKFYQFDHASGHLIINPIHRIFDNQYERENINSIEFVRGEATGEIGRNAFAFNNIKYLI